MISNLYLVALRIVLKLQFYSKKGKYLHLIFKNYKMFKSLFKKKTTEEANPATKSGYRQKRKKN